MHKILWLLVAAGLLSGCATPYSEQARSGSNEEIVGMIRKGDIKYHTGGRIQPVDATHSLNISAGVWKPSVLRGLWFNCLAIALS